MDDFKQSVSTIHRRRQLSRLVGIMVGIVLAFVIFVLGMVVGIQTERVRPKEASTVASRKKIAKPIEQQRVAERERRHPTSARQTEREQQPRATPSEDTPQPAGLQHKEQKEEDTVRLTFYETLTQKTPEQKMAMTTKPKVATVPRQPVKAPDQKKRYFVYVASFKNKGYAEELKEKLVKKGYGVHIVPVEITGRGLWYRVKVGGYSTQQNAERAHEKLTIAENLQGARVVLE